MKNSEGEGPKWRIRTKPSTTSFSTISQSICRRPNTPKNLMLQIDFLNQGMIYKSIRAVSGKRIEKSKKSPIWRDRFMRCRERISRMASEAFKTKIVSPAKVLQTTDLCILTNSLSSIRMEIFHSFREMISLKITELLIIRWSTQMMRHSVSLNLTRYMLIRKTKKEILMQTTSIRAEKSLLSIP